MLRQQLEMSVAKPIPSRNWEMGVFACSVLNLGKTAAGSTYTPTGKLLFVCLIRTWGLMNAKPCGLSKIDG